ncbi:coiled-coil domain-containing protein 154-like isoform X2 [Scyliorhinus canicula]|uniref:coiled-coil domain-containing protein 154-like isoform X2 n=1 Tax=Scyliorhinus canicula TaxID=7830 RepID=UPI0018F74786|nr:coiled-coil domain-containing protein 154-like isoform X2 [Scyliorhinus canicula]
MNVHRSTGKASPRRGILPNLYMPDPDKERQYGAGRRGQHLQDSDYNREKLPSLETETPDNVDESSKISLLESRVKSVEDANYSLREEVIQLQNELKQIGTNGINFQDQHSPWSTIMDSIGTSNNMIAKIVSRLKEAEGMLFFEKRTVDTILDHMSQLDQVINDQQEDMKRQKSNLEHRMGELQTVVREIEDQRNQTKPMVSNLLNGLGQEKNKMEWQNSEIKLIREEMEKVSKRMVNDINIILSSIKKQNEIQRQAELSVMQIKTTFEQRLLQIEDAFSYIMNRQTDLESEGKTLQQKMNARLNELTATVAQQDHKREDDLYKLNQKEMDRSYFPESIYSQGKMHQLLEDLSNKLFQKEIKLREEMQKKFLDLEKNLRRLENMRGEHEKVLRAENEKNLSSLQQLHVEEIDALKDKQSRHRPSEHYVKTDEDVNKLADTCTYDLSWIQRVLKAEIQERMKQGTQLGKKIDDLNERLSLALVTLQKAVDILQEDLNKIKKPEAMPSKYAESKAEPNAKTKEDFQDRVWDVESMSRTMGTLLADIYRVIEETPGEIAKIKANLMVSIEEIQKLRSDLIKLKTGANLEQENDTVSRDHLFIKEHNGSDDKEINRWGVYQATRWMQWKNALRNVMQASKLKNQRNESLSDKKDNGEI